MTVDIRRGDAFVFNQGQQFGCVLAPVTSREGLALVQMQSGLVGYAHVEDVIRGRHELEGRDS